MKRGEEVEVEIAQTKESSSNSHERRRHHLVYNILPEAGALLCFGLAFILFAIVRMHRLNRE